MTAKACDVLRPQIINGLHSLDHTAVKSTNKRVGKQYYWPTLKKDVETFVKCCVPCEKVKPNKRLTNTGSFEVPDKRFSHVLVDIVGPLPPATAINFYSSPYVGPVDFCMPCRSGRPRPRRWPQPSSPPGPPSSTAGHL